MRRAKDGAGYGEVAPLRFGGADEVRRAYDFQHLQSFLDLYYEGAAVLREPRDFDDLARREIDIQQVANMTCMGFQPVNLAAVQASIRSTGKLPPDLFAGTPRTHHLVPVGVSDFKRNIITEVH